MRGARLLILLTAALAASGCARRTAMNSEMAPAPGTQYIVTDPASGRQMLVTQPAAPMMAQAPQTPTYAPTYAPRGDERGLMNSSRVLQPQPQQQQQAYYPPQVIQVPARPQAVGGPYAAAPVQYPPPRYAPPQQRYVQNYGQSYGPAQQSYASVGGEQAYTLDAGDKLRVVVFGQDQVSGAYMVGAGGAVTLPLVGSIPARGLTTTQLSQVIAAKLRQGFVRDPNVSVEIDAYRPFFILGEVTNPGQYPYSPNMTAETAVAIAGGFAPRASKSNVKVTRNAPGQQFSGEVPLNFPLRPGDTVQVKERWF
jgi:protein involved in polysaccharide export with SLBB domain